MYYARNRGPYNRPLIFDSLSRARIRNNEITLGTFKNEAKYSYTRMLVVRVLGFAFDDRRPLISLLGYASRIDVIRSFRLSSRYSAIFSPFSIFKYS